MRFYRHHIGDYDAATAHLSWDEDMAYTRLLRLYYRTEAPLPADVGQLCRLIRASKPAHRQAVEAVLAEFFTLEDDGWHQKRADEEILKAGAKAEASRENGTKGGRPPKPRDNPAETYRVSEPKPNETLPTTHNPLPITQEKETRAARASLLAGFEEWWQEFPNKVAKPAARKEWPAARRKADLDALMDGLKRYIASKPSDRTWCNPATWLNQERWLDQPAPVAVNGHHGETGMLVDPEANERKQAAAIAKGIRLASVPDRRVWGWVAKGWLTAEQASKAGYAA